MQVDGGDTSLFERAGLENFFSAGSHVVLERGDDCDSLRHLVTGEVIHLLGPAGALV